MCLFKFYSAGYGAGSDPQSLPGYYRSNTEMMYVILYIFNYDKWVFILSLVKITSYKDTSIIFCLNA